MKPINTAAPVSCSHSILINAELLRVWNVLTDISQWTTWQNEISNVRLNDSLQAGTTFAWKTGGAKIHSIIHTVNPHSQFGWTGKTMGIFAIHNWTLSEENGKIRVHVEESMEGFLARLFKKSFQKNLKKGMHTWLDLLKRECENNR